MTSVIAASQTLGAIVTDHPASARILEHLGLDYCCGGQRTLAASCAELGLDVNEVAHALTVDGSDDEPKEWATMTMRELVDHLESTHHRYLQREFPRLATLGDKVVAAHGSRHPELVDIQATLTELTAELQPHLMKEEQILFPMIRELDAAAAAPEFHCGSLCNPISVMLREHDRAGELLARLRAQTNGYTVPTDGCASYQAFFEALAELEADTHLHIHKENNLLFPAVLAAEAAYGQ